MTVFVYVNTSKPSGHPNHIKVFANVDAAEKWFEEDPEGMACGRLAAFPDGASSAPILMATWSRCAVATFTRSVWAK
jgi:hypothetical protein